jgi:hypothetical protein
MMSEERIQGSGGLSIFVRSLRPAGRPRGVVAIVPGFNSHSIRFFGRGDWIRTSDPLRPRQVRYQAALRPDFCWQITGTCLLSRSVAQRFW